MGSRYGGLKQLDALGPNGETIMDYSIYDAIQAGFGKIVFIIRKDFEEDFREKILKKYEGHIPAELCFQSLDALPEGFSCPKDRVKPWGTNHAVMMAKDVVKEPFCVINCDDFYNRDCFMVIGKFLSELPEGSKNRYAMVGFRVGNTLSENGTVSRGICSKDADDNLTTVVERTKIMRIDGKVSYMDEEDKWVTVDDNTPVSMNVWGFTPDEPEVGVLHPADGKQAYQRRHSDSEGARHHKQLVRSDLSRRQTWHRGAHTEARQRRRLSKEVVLRFQVDELTS